MNFFKITASVAVLASLAACGGSSGNVDMAPTAPVAPSVPTGYAQVEARGVSLANTYGAAINRGAYTNLATLPTTGSARFSGAGAYVLGGDDVLSGQSIQDNADAISRIDMQVRLTDGRVTGRASEFYETETRTPIGGTLALAGSLDRSADLDSEFGINGTANGTLRSATLGTVQVESTLVADIYGTNGRFVTGFMDGSADTGAGTDRVQGAFIAARN